MGEREDAGAQVEGREEQRQEVGSEVGHSLEVAEDDSVLVGGLGES